MAHKLKFIIGYLQEYTQDLPLTSAMIGNSRATASFLVVFEAPTNRLPKESPGLRVRLVASARICLFVGFGIRLYIMLFSLLFTLLYEL